MAEVSLTATVDSGGLMRAIPEIVAFGRRTMMEQCVTSLAVICLDAQELTPFVTTGRIDAELNQEVTIGKGKTNKMTRGQATILARMNPNSKFNKETGGRWAMRRPELSATKFKKAYGDGGMARRVFWEIVNNADDRMKSSRHSSTHFVQHGWTPAIRSLLTHKDFVGWKSRGKSAAAGRVTSGNTVNPMNLGFASVTYSGDVVQAVAANEVGDPIGRSNTTLALKHRKALIEYGTQPAQAAVEREEVTCKEKIEEYLDRGLVQKFGHL